MTTKATFKVETKDYKIIIMHNRMLFGVPAKIIIEGKPKILLNFFECWAQYHDLKYTQSNGIQIICDKSHLIKKAYKIIWSFINAVRDEDVIEWTLRNYDDIGGYFKYTKRNK